MSADGLRVELRRLGLDVVAEHVRDGAFGSIDWAGFQQVAGREATAQEITAAWLAMGRADGWAP